MPSIIEQLTPSRQNSVQRSGFFVSLALAVVVLLLHFPFEGYAVNQWVVIRHGTGECPRTGGIEELKASTNEQIRQRIEEDRLCRDESEEQLRPFNEWRSYSPVIPWFGSVLHTLIALCFVIGLGLIWLWIFRSTNESNEPN